MSNHSSRENQHSHKGDQKEYQSDSHSRLGKAPKNNDDIDSSDGRDASSGSERPHSSSGKNKSNNFANDPEKAREAGRKGGQSKGN